MNSPIIKFDKVCKNYGERPVLDDFCLEVAPREFLTVIGSSGCGKTTMLKMINGLLRPDSGLLLLWGEDVSGADIIQLRRRIGYVIQGTGLFPHLSVAANITYVPGLHGRRQRRQAEKAVARLLETVGLEADLARRYPSQLSGGQQQRVGIARALAGSPEIVLMDEPFSAVDEITREKLQEEIASIQRKLELTVIFVTHDIREACKLGSRMLVMREGAVAQCGPPEEIRANPADSFVQKLMERSGQPDPGQTETRQTTH